MKKRIKLILIALFFTLVLMVFVGVGQFALTLTSVAEQVEMHLQEVEKSTVKYMASEKNIAESLLAFYDKKADYMAYLLREGIIEEIEDVLKEYTGIIGVDAIYLYTTDEDGTFPDIYMSSNGITDINEIMDSGDQTLSSNVRVEGEKGVLITSDGSDELKLFNSVYSWENSITNTGLGNNGLTLVCDKDTKEITSASDESVLGKTVKGMDLDKEIETSLTNKSKEGYGKSGDYDLMFFQVGNEGYIGSVIDISAKKDGERFAFSEGYVFCGFPLTEIISEYISSGGIYIIVFLVVIVLFILYIFFSEEKRKTDPVYAQKLSTFPLLGAFVVLCISLFLFRLSVVSNYLLSCRNFAVNTADMMEKLVATTEEVQAVYDEQHLDKCRMAADILTMNPELKTREGLRKISSMLGVKYTYLFDKNGKVIVTDSPYDSFELSEDEEDQSYAFRKLLEGNEYLIQDPMSDDASGDMMQYVGVSVRNEEDLADGFVQIAIEVKALEELYDNINVSRKLNDIGVGEDGFSFVIDDGVVTNSGKKKMIGKKADELGIKKDQMKDGFSGYLVLDDEKYYAAASETEDIGLVYVVLPIKSMQKGQGSVILFASLITLICMFIMARSANKNLDKEYAANDDEGGSIEDESAKDNREIKPEKRNVLGKLADTWGISVKESNVQRWNWGNKSFEFKSPEGKILFVIKVALFLFCIVIVYMFFFGTMHESTTSFLIYILNGQWERGVNIFAITSSLILICVIYVMVEILESVLNLVAGISDTKTETVCHLLRSLIKYGAVLSVFYYCLALFGFDTKTLVASAGILSVVVGFGAQKLISDVICGLFLVFENQISVGDRVSIGGWSGTVTEIGIRTTKIADFDDVKSFNNSEITGLINYTTKKEGLISREIGMSYEEDLERVAEIFKRELPKIQNNIKGAVDAPYYDGVARLDDSAIILVFRVRVETPTRKAAMRDFNRELIELFNRNNIEIPYSKIEILSKHSSEDNTAIDRI